MTNPALLQITDGTLANTIDLIDENSGLMLSSWRPRAPQYKDGGVFQNSLISEGRRLVHAVLDDVVETMELKARNENPDAVILDMLKLRRLIKQAAEYWTEEWNGTFVYLVARAYGETNTRYAILSLSEIVDDENPYGDTFLQLGGGAVQNNIVLSLNRGQWRSQPPGQSDTIQASATGTYFDTDTTETEAIDGDDDDIWHPLDPRTAGAPATTTLRIGAGGDGPSRAGVKFDNVNVPQGAEIIFARIRFEASSNQSGSEVYVRVSGIAEDNAGDFANGRDDLFPRTLTENYINWPEPGDGVGLEAWVAGTSYDTPNLAPIVQEIVDRSGWAANQSMAFVIDDNNSDTGASVFRLAWAHENVSGGTPAELEIIYSTPVTYGQEATVQHDLFVANKDNKANISHVYHNDDSTGAWSSNLQTGSLPFFLFPSSPTTDDRLLVGIDTSLVNSGPFSSIIFDLDIATSISDNGVILWHYWNGAAWTDLNTQDNTDVDGDFYYRALNSTGVNGVFFEHPSDWATLNLNSHFGGSAPNVTGYWIMGIVEGGTITRPRQANRIIYTPTWSKASIDSAQLGGDMNALFRLTIDNPADGVISQEPQRWVNRLIVSARSDTRGSNFTPFINACNEQNPKGVEATDISPGSFTADLDAATGVAYHIATTAVSLQRGVIFQMSEFISSEYIGRYHVFVRAKQTSGAAGDTGVQLFRSWGLEEVQVSDVIRLQTTGEIELLDMGPMALPGTEIVTSSDSTYNTFTLYVVNDNGSASLTVYDLILMPTDEWVGDFTDLNNDFRTVLGRWGLTEATRLEIDNIVNPKIQIRSALRRKKNNWLWGSWFPVINGPPTLKPSRDQSLYFMMARYANKGTGPSEVLTSEPEMALRLSVTGVNRYSTMRGAN